MDAISSPRLVSSPCQVPADAQFMDMVFSDTGDLHGGFYDNNGGLVRRLPSSSASCLLLFELAPLAYARLLAGLRICITARS